MPHPDDWRDHLADLEAALDSAARAALAAEVADRTRRELGAVDLAARLRAARGTLLGLRVRGLGVVNGWLVAQGPDWVEVRQAPDASPTSGDRPHAGLLVSAAAIVTVTGLPSGARPASGGVQGRLDLRYRLRGLARDRAWVRLTLVDGTTVRGVAGGVGRDWWELAAEPHGSQLQTVALSALAGVQPLPPGADGL